MSSQEIRLCVNFFCFESHTWGSFECSTCMRLSQMYPSSGGVLLWCVSQKHIKVCFRHVSVDACIYFWSLFHGWSELNESSFLTDCWCWFLSGATLALRDWCKDFYYIECWKGWKIVLNGKKKTILGFILSQFVRENMAGKHPAAQKSELSDLLSSWSLQKMQFIQQSDMPGWEISINQTGFFFFVGSLPPDYILRLAVWLVC